MTCKPAILLALFLAAGALRAQGAVKPLWISALPQQAGRVYAMGLAPYAAGEAQAVTQASANARVEVLTRLRATVKGETKVRSSATVTREGGRTTGSAEQRVGQNTDIQAQATELPGLVVEETWADGPGRTAYALAYLDVAVAERELRTRFSALKNDLFQEPETPAEPRERMRMLNRLKGAQVELALLDDMAGLLGAGGGDAKLRAQIRAGKLSVDREMEQLRASLTLSMDAGGQNPAQIVTLLRNAALKAGLGWAARDGEFQLVLDYKGERRTAKADLQKSSNNGYWGGGWVTRTVNHDTGIIVARGSLEITLKDKAGNQYESMELEAKGLGVSDFQAEKRLQEDFRAQLEKAFGAWLERLVR